MTICDICNGEGGGVVVPVLEFQRHVATGRFDPIRLGLTAGRASWTEEKNLSFWMGVVQANETDWFLCHTCHRAYLETTAAAPARDARDAPTDPPKARPSPHLLPGPPGSRVDSGMARRSGKALGSFLFLAAAAGGGSLYAFNTDHSGWGILFGVVAAAIAVGGTVGSFAGACPHCGASLECLHPGVNGPCGYCSHYFRLKDGRLLTLKEDCIEITPSFDLPMEALLPALCAGCGRDAVRTEPVSSSAWAGLRLSANVPHCATCKGGAHFASASRLTANLTEDTTFIALRVKSHRLYRVTMLSHDATYRLHA